MGGERKLKMKNSKLEITSCQFFNPKGASEGSTHLYHFADSSLLLRMTCKEVS